MSQIETLMVLALGSALTFVVVLLFGRFFWGLAVAAAARRNARMAPIEVLDAQAERDKLRAEHALMARKLELRLQDIKMRMAEQMAEVSRNRNRVQGLVEEIERKDDLLRNKDKEIAALAAQIEFHRAELATAHKTIDSQNVDSQRGEAEMVRLQAAFRKVTVSMRDKQQALNSLSDDLRTAVPQSQFAPPLTGDAVRRRAAEISAISDEMRHEPTMSEAAEMQNLSSAGSDALAARIDEAQRLSDDMERELKTLDDLLGLSQNQTEAPLRQAKRPRAGGNVISLAQRIRALQKGMGE